MDRGEKQSTGFKITNGLPRSNFLPSGSISFTSKISSNKTPAMIQFYLHLFGFSTSSFVRSSRLLTALQVFQNISCSRRPWIIIQKYISPLQDEKKSRFVWLETLSFNWSNVTRKLDHLLLIGLNSFKFYRPTQHRCLWYGEPFCWSFGRDVVKRKS